MKEFIRKHEARIHGVLSCFDRMLFRGYLPIMSGWSMAQFLKGLEVNCSSLKPFLLQNADRVKEHATAMAKKHGRPFQYLACSLRKEDAARRLAERDGTVQAPATQRSRPRSSRHSALATGRTRPTWCAPRWRSESSSGYPRARVAWRSGKNLAQRFRDGAEGRIGLHRHALHPAP
jgi:hypothetical protein